MSVQGEFERYLSALIRSLRKRGDPYYAASIERLSVLLEQDECPLAQRAREVGRVLADTPSVRAEFREEPGAPAIAHGGGSQGLDSAIDGMQQMVHIILGDSSR